MDGDPGLAGRVDALESRAAIERLIADYAHGFDRRDELVLREIWHEGAVLDLGEPTGRLEGVEAIMRGAHAIWDAVPVQHHWMANPRIDIAGDTAIGVVALASLIHHRKGGPSMLGGRYDDRYERRGGRWGIVGRRFHRDFYTPLKDWRPVLGTEATPRP